MVGFKIQNKYHRQFFSIDICIDHITFPNEHDNKYDNRFNFKTHLDVQKALHTNIDG